MKKIEEKKIEKKKCRHGGRTTSAGLGSTLRKKRAHMHVRAYNVHVVPIIVLRIFSYPKFWCLTFFYDKN